MLAQPHPVGSVESVLMQCLSKLARDTRPTTRRGVRARDDLPCLGAAGTPTEERIEKWRVGVDWLFEDEYEVA